MYIDLTSLELFSLVVTGVLIGGYGLVLLLRLYRSQFRGQKLIVGALIFFFGVVPAVITFDALFSTKIESDPAALVPHAKLTPSTLAPGAPIAIGPVTSDFDPTNTQDIRSKYERCESEYRSRYGLTEEDLQYTMEKYGHSRKQVLEVVCNKPDQR